MQILQDQSEFNVIFVHSKLDDAGLTPYAFRVYCHIARRANRAKSAWPGLGSIARICEISESTARRAIQELEERDMLIVQRCAGGNSTNLYTLTSAEQWKSKKHGTPVQQTPHHCPTDTPPLSVGHPKVFQEGNPDIPELKNSGTDLGELFTFPKPVEKEAILAETPKRRGRPPKPTDPRHSQFIDAFCEAHFERVGERYFVKAQDGAMLKKLLTHTDKPVGELMEIVKWCWYRENEDKFCPKDIKVSEIWHLAAKWNTIIKEAVIK